MLNKYFNFIYKIKKVSQETILHLIGSLFYFFIFYSFFFAAIKLLNIFVENHKATDAHMELITLPPL